MSDSSYSLGLNPNNNEPDQKDNNRAIDKTDLDQVKLTVGKNETSEDTLQMHSNRQNQNQTNSLINSQNIMNSQSNRTLINNNTQTTLCNSSTGDNLTNDLAPQSLPPSYYEVPGTVPLNAGSTAKPPPTYDEVVNPNVAPPSYHSLFGQVQEARNKAKTLPDLIRKLIIILLGTIGLAILISFTVLIPFTMILVGISHLEDCPAENIPLFLLIGGITWLAKNISNFFAQCSTRRTLRSTNSTTTNNNSSTNNSSTNPCASRFSTNACTAESNPCASSSTNCGNANNSNRTGRCVINLDNEQTTELQTQSRRDFLINCFIITWFLTGCIMVYRIYPPNYLNPSAPNYCHRTVYIYAFWLLTSTFIIFALFFACVCCVSLAAVFQTNSEIRL